MVNIITVPAVTGRNGDVACVSTSKMTYYRDDGSPCSSETFANINTYVEDYFSIRVYEVGETKLTTSETKPATKISMTRVTLATPFVYQPDWAIKSEYRDTNLITTASNGYIPIEYFDDTKHGEGYPDYGLEDYGYIPQALVDSLSSDPKISAALSLGSSSLRPAGPRVEKSCIEDFSFGVIKAGFGVAINGITDSSLHTLDSIGCFHPGACPSVDASAAATAAIERIALMPSSASTQMTHSASKAAETQRVPNEEAPTGQTKTTPSRKSQDGKGPPRVLLSQSSPSRNPNGPHSDQRPPKQQHNPDQAQPSPFETEISSSQLPRPAPVVEQVSVLQTANPAPEDKIPPKELFLSAAAPVITIGSLILTADSATNFVLESQTLAPGSSPVVVSGTTYSLLHSASALIVNGRTLALTSPQSLQGLGGLIFQGFSNSKTDQVQNSHAAPTKVITVHNQPITENSASQYIVQGQTLAAGAVPITVDSVTYSLAPSGSALVINGVESAIPAASESVPPLALTVKIGEGVITANSQSEFSIGSKTLSPGGSPVTISGTTYSLDRKASAIIVNGDTISIQAAGSDLFPTPTSITSNHVVTANHQAEYQIDGQTLSPGGSPLVISGNTYSLAPQATAIVLNGKTTPLQAASSGAVIEGNSVSANPEIVIGTQTAIAGGAAITVSGVVVSFPASGNSIIIGSSTEVLPSGEAPTLTIGSQTVTARRIFEHELGGQTLSLGESAATISSVSVSLTAGGSQLVFQGSTIDLTSARATSVTSFTGNGIKAKPGLKEFKGFVFVSMLIFIII